MRIKVLGLLISCLHVSNAYAGLNPKWGNVANIPNEKDLCVVTTTKNDVYHTCDEMIKPIKVAEYNYPSFEQLDLAVMRIMLEKKYHLILSSNPGDGATSDRTHRVFWFSYR